MTRLNQIEEGLRQIEAGRFQKLANEYLCRERRLRHLSAFGSQAGTDKTTVGIPDAFSYEDGGYVLIAYTTNISDTVKKIEDDINECLTKAHLPNDKIRKVICCHTNFRLSPCDYHKLQRIDERVEVIPPSQMALDLADRYVLLAHEYFGIALGSGAFKTKAEYLELQDRRQYATSQSLDIMYRDDEIGELTGYLENGTRAVILTGPSGCGKTKLALDACEKYCRDNAKNLLILESRNAQHAVDDIKTVIKEADNIVLLVDDANQQTALDFLLDVAADKEDTAIVATVRSSSLHELETQMGQHLKLKTLVVHPLDEERISSIIRYQCGIVDYSALERITSIAHGNLRLAIMAATALIKRDVSTLKSPHDMLSAYIEPQLKKYSKDEITTLEVFAVFGVCDVEPTDEAYSCLVTKGIEAKEILKFAKEFNDDEVVDLLSNAKGVLAIRFQEQNLRDYLVYKAFLVDRVLDLDLYIIKHILLNRNSVTAIIRILLDVFSDKKTSKALEDAARKALTQAGKDRALKKALMFDFHMFYGATALEYAHSLIEQNPCRDISKELHKGNGFSDTSVVLRILSLAFRQPSYSEMAIDLIANCVEKGSETPEDYRWFFSSYNVLTSMSLEKGFKYEETLLDALANAYKETNSSNIAICLLIFTDTLLRGDGQDIKLIDSRKLRMSYFQIPFCSQRARLDYKCFKALHLMLDYEQYSKDIWSHFRHHFGWYGDKVPEPKRVEMLSEEIELLREVLPDFLAGASLDEYECFLQLDNLCSIAGIPPIGANTLFNIGVVDAWLLISKPESIENTISNWPIEKLSAACEAIAAIPNESDLSWDSQEIVAQIFSFTVNCGFSMDQCLHVLQCYLQKRDVSRVTYLRNNLFDSFIDRFGYKSIRDKINAMALWNIRTKAIDSIDCYGILVHSMEVDGSRLLETLDDGELHLDFQTASQVMGAKRSFLYEYTTRSLENIRNHPDRISEFFRPAADGDESFLQTLDSAFIDKESELADWYFIFLNEQFFDYDGKIALFLFRKNEHFASDYMSSLFKSHWIRHDNAAMRIQRMWVKGYIETPTFVSQLLLQFYSRKSSYANPICIFLPIHSMRISALPQCWDWLFSYIEEIVSDVRRVQDVVDAFGSVGDQERLAVLSHVLKMDTTGNLINKLSLDRTSMSGSDDGGFSKAYRREAEFIRELSESLPSTVTYLPHKAWLEQYADNNEVMAQHELWRAFHEI